jgi:hypothetical protein
MNVDFNPLISKQLPQRPVDVRPSELTYEFIVITVANPLTGNQLAEIAVKGCCYSFCFQLAL